MGALPPKPASLEHISDAHWEAAFEEVARRAGYGETGLALRRLNTKGKNGAADYARCLILLGEVDEPKDPIDAAIWRNPMDNARHKFHKLALNESFERVARVAKERAEFNRFMALSNGSNPMDNTHMLKPCPFCGGEQVTTAPDHEFGDVTWDAVCKACGTRVRRDLEQQAIAAWNTRRPDPQVTALVEAATVICAILDMNHNGEKEGQQFEDAWEVVSDIEKSGVHQMLCDALATFGNKAND